MLKVGVAILLDVSKTINERLWETESIFILLFSFFFFPFFRGPWLLDFYCGIWDTLLVPLHTSHTLSKH